MGQRGPASSRGSTQSARARDRRRGAGFCSKSSPANHNSVYFVDGNGGEYRKTFHAYAPPFAQLVESPATVSGTAMQIDTWNREKMKLYGLFLLSLLLL